MIRFVDGQPVLIPDDASITPDQDLRDAMNGFLRQIQAMDTPELRRQFLEGRLSDTPGLDWFRDQP